MLSFLQLSRKQLYRARHAQNLVVKKAEKGIYVRPINRIKRVAIFGRYLRERVGFTRTVFVDESHIWLDPVSQFVVVSKKDRHGNVIQKPKNVASVSL